MWSTPPLRSRLGSLGHTSTVSTPGLDDLCSEWLAASLNAASAAASASSAGAGRFLRSFESAFHLSVIAAIASRSSPVIVKLSEYLTTITGLLPGLKTFV